MEITLTMVVIFLLGMVLGGPIVRVARAHGPMILLVAMVALSIPLFTLGPHPVILGIYTTIAIYLISIALKLLRDPSKFNEFWKSIDEN